MHYTLLRGLATGLGSKIFSLLPPEKRSAQYAQQTGGLQAKRHSGSGYVRLTPLPMQRSTWRYFTTMLRQCCDKSNSQTSQPWPRPKARPLRDLACSEASWLRDPTSMGDSGNSNPSLAKQVFHSLKFSNLLQSNRQSLHWDC